MTDLDPDEKMLIDSHREAYVRYERFSREILRLMNSTKYIPNYLEKLNKAQMEMSKAWEDRRYFFQLLQKRRKEKANGSNWIA